jgi:hypothetical protein
MADGKVNLGRFGPVYVAGMTVEQARKAVERKLSKSLKGPGAEITVKSYNSKVVYLVLRGGPSGDNVVRIPLPHPLSAEMNVGALLKGADYPYPIDLATARIDLRRPAPKGVGRELALPVAWDPASKQPTAETNHPLLPGDRIFVSTADEASVEKVSQAPYYSAATAPPRPPVIPTAVAAAPSTPGPSKALQSGQRQVMFDILVLEDPQNSLAEFESLQEQGFMLADSSSTLGALRALEKRQLIAYRAEPRLVTTLGRTAEFSVGELTPEAGDGESLYNGTHVNVFAAEDKDRLLVRWLVRVSDNGTHVEGRSNIVIPSGQTAVYKMGPPSKSHGRRLAPLYIVLTPTMIK